MSYHPAPIDSSAIVLPAELHALTERLAENAHDLWAAQRLTHGWTQSPQSDDARKLYPFLVPYTELLDKQKEFDRIGAMGTLKAILALGYTVTAQVIRPRP